MFLLHKRKLLIRCISLFLIHLLLFECFWPTTAFALTSGPSQPEFNSFSPAGVSDMVNPFTGDFGYNIDLLNVPGFEGGYPLNLSYNAGISMEQEASWVGLGWNLNVGSVTRQLRGIPDDFKGDLVEKEKNIRPSRTVAEGKTIVPVEVIGVELSKSLPKTTVKKYLNNYTGLGYQLGADFSVFNYENQKGRFTGGIALTYDSQTGFGMKPNVSFEHRVKKSSSSFRGVGLSVGFSSREGMNDISFDLRRTKVTTRDGKSVDYDSKTGNYTRNGEIVNIMYNKDAAGVSFAASSPVASVDFPRTSTSFSVGAKAGVSAFGITFDANQDLFYSSTKIAQNNLKLPAYGYFYSEEAKSSRALMDFHRENDVKTTKLSKTLPVTIADNDVFNVSAQGLGAMVRGYRSDVGFYSDPHFTSSGMHIGAGLEFDLDAAPGTKMGVNSISIQPSTTYSGDWSKGKGDLGSTFHFEGKKTTNQDNTHGFYEPVYFKSAGEITPDYEASYSPNHIYSNDAHRVNIRKKASVNGAVPIARNELSNQDEMASNLNNYTNKRMSRVKRVTEYQFLTRKEAGLPIDPDVKKEHHIGKITALQPGGKRFEFGLPLYNLIQKEAAFSVERDYKGTENGIVGYSARDASSGNKSGIDHLYQYTQLPPYAHTFLITNIKSMDYVDIDDNGCSSKDFGEYVEFKYTNTGSYKWRAPYNEFKANYAPGYLSSKDDDKASYNYGEKEIRYIDTIETKTHLVKFVTSNREDAMGVAGSNGGKGGTGQKKKLDKIILYKKPYGYSGNGATLIPVKTVHFEYTYDLCKHIPNNSGATVSDLFNGASNKKGKLTLKRVWFSYGGIESSNTKLADYQFDYHESNSAENPDYNITRIDRWGNYQFKRFDNGTTNLKAFPYTAQNYTQSEMDNIAGAWSLKQIKTPSGGEIDVFYEMDDYQYVENRKAMMMAVIKGFGSNYSYNDSSDRLANNTRYVFIEIPKVITAAELPLYFENVDRFYFKVLMGLKKITTPRNNNLSTVTANKIAYDYVEGYAEREGQIGIASTGSNSTIAYVKIKRVALNDNGTGATCPIRKAGFQHLRMNRADLLNNTFNIPDVKSPMAILAPILSMVGTLKSAVSLLTGFNTVASMSYCKSTWLNNAEHPSYIRINAVGKKYGGGHRVKKITINDNWNKLSSATGSNSFSYGKEYIYRLNDGTSSGVASYEPLIGGEENPFKQPIYYGPDKLFFARDDAFYVEEPLGESFFPSPVVGYSKIISNSLSHSNVNYGKEGTVVHEYYTAKDFPTIVQRTGIMSKRNSPRMIFIPLLGMKTMNNDGYSQGVSIQLNNMHGKEKKKSTYRYTNIDRNNEFSNPAAFLAAMKKLEGEVPTTSVESHYHLKDGKEYQSGKVNEIRATVSVLQGDGTIKQKEMGKQVDFYGSLRENYTESYTSSFYPNAHQWYVVVIPTLIPFLGKSVGLYREATTTKVITRNGVLKKKIAYDGQALVTTENVVYDTETGEVKLSKFNNSFEDPVYNYTIPGHRYYSELKGAYQNIGAEIDVNQISASKITAFRKGDEVHYYPNGLSGPFQKLWIDNIVGTNLTIKDASGNVVPVSGGTLKVIRSGNKNLQPYGAGSIVSLENPLDLVNGLSKCKNSSATLDLTQLNMFAAAGKFSNNGRVKAKRVMKVNVSTPYLSGFDFYVEAPMTGGLVTYKWMWHNTSNSTYELLRTVNFNPVQKAGWENATVSYQGGTIVPGTSSLRLTLNGESHVVLVASLYPELKEICIRSNAKVLHSEANTYTDQFNIEYQDFLKTQMSNAAYTALQTKINDNPYRFGKKGIPRVKAPYFYRIKRSQNGVAKTFKSDIRHDGVYNLYDWYDFNSGSLNPGWIPKGEVTLYSPYGHELETKDAKGIYSSALYGYENLLPTAVAANARYKEIAFEGYEDYQSTNYPDAGLMGHGHLPTSANSANVIQSDEAHTGRYALNVNGTVSYPLKDGMILQNGQEYIASVWVKQKAASPISLTINGVSISYDDTKTNIEGWQQLMLKFTKGATDPVLTLSGTNFYLDDLRVFPNDGSLVSYVYDKDRLRLMAVLDNQNYATIYNYDMEGNLTQVKKETERGIMTLKSGRISTKKQLNP